MSMQNNGQNFTSEVNESIQHEATLKSILNGMEALVCVCEFDSFKILFLNDSFRNNYGIEKDVTGKVCYEILQCRTEPCEQCPYEQLKQEPDKVLCWEHRDSVKGNVLQKTGRAIDWVYGKKAHLEYAIDITAITETKEKLERRDKMLDIINKAALVLLKRENVSFQDAMNQGISLIAGIASVERMSVFRNFVKPDGLHLTQLYRWYSKVGSMIDIRPELTDLPYATSIPQWEKILSSGQPICGLIRSMPEAKILEQFDCVSILLVPIFNNRVFWGIVFYEKMTEEVFTSSEIEILRSASFMLANAVIRRDEAAIIRATNERAMLMLNAAPYGCILWNQKHKVIDYNEATMSLLGIANKKDPFENLKVFFPEEQPDGQRSEQLLFEMLNKAFDQGRCDFEWMLQTLSGTLIPTKVTLVRVDYGDEFVVASYIRDLRPERKMAENILQLESKIEKIFYDPLTEIYSRRFFEENIENLIYSLSHTGGTLCLMMIDIDFFKQYNDTYGHIKGDDCLKIIAKALQTSTAKEEEFVARYGGEEFVVVLPNTDETGAQMLAEKILNDIRSLKLPHVNSKVADWVTVSIGAVCGSVEPDSSRDSFLQSADKMLYQSKQTGRNKFSYCSLVPRGIVASEQ